MVLEPPESVRKLQMALQAKAKGAPGYRFYLLYDKLYRKDVLKYAYDRCKAKKGFAPTGKSRLSTAHVEDGLELVLQGKHNRHPDADQHLADRSPFHRYPCIRHSAI